MTLDRRELNESIDGAGAILAPLIVKTPLVHVPVLSKRFHRPIFLKLESHQHGGSFKYRPALLNILTQLNLARDHGVVTSSSGNFAIATALAAKQIGVKATIVLRPSAAQFKCDQVKALGAEVVICADDYEAREEHVARLVQERGLLRLHPHDSILTVAGDATVGQEICEQNNEISTILVPASGAGLLGGIALAVEGREPEIRVYGVQPEANGSLRRSIDSGERIGRSDIDSVADGLTAAIPGRIGFEISQTMVEDVLTVSEESLIEATCVLFDATGEVVEPAGAAGLAALIEGALPDSTEPTALVISGGNVDPEIWKGWVESRP